MREQIKLQREAFVAGARAFMETRQVTPGPGFNDYWEPRAAALYPLTITEPRVVPSQHQGADYDYRVVDGELQQRWRYPNARGAWIRVTAVYIEDIPVIAELRANPTITKAIE